MTLEQSLAEGYMLSTQISNILEFKVCDADIPGRILKSDQSSRSLNVNCGTNVIPFERTKGVRRVNALSELKVGETAVLVALELPESVQNHLMHMGFVPDASVTALRRAPAGDPTVYLIDGMEIALRHETAEAIRVRRTGSQNPIAAPEHQNDLAIASGMGIVHFRGASR
jgi:ferrous iron transport protein A